jgi:hypothetical protein
VAYSSATHTLVHTLMHSPIHTFFFVSQLDTSLSWRCSALAAPLVFTAVVRSGHVASTHKRIIDQNLYQHHLHRQRHGSHRLPMLQSLWVSSEIDMPNLAFLTTQLTTTNVTVKRCTALALNGISSPTAIDPSRSSTMAHLHVAFIAFNINPLALRCADVMWTAYRSLPNPHAPTLASTALP